jgi:hypothetical protein
MMIALGKDKQEEYKENLSQISKVKHFLLQYMLPESTSP